MKIVLDSNVLIPALAGIGICQKVLDACVAEGLVSSHEILEETRAGLTRKLKVAESDARTLIADLSADLILHQPQAVETSACRDPNDLHVLGLAVAAAADCIVTGDQDLLILKEFRGIPILTPAQFLKTLGRGP